MYGQPEISRLPRVLLALGHTVAIILAAWILFGVSAGTHLIGVTFVDTPDARRMAVFATAAVYLVRVLGTTFVLLRRRMAWAEALTILVWVAFIHIWFAVLTRTVAAPLGPPDVLALALYVGGSYVNTGSEWARLRWKRKPEHAGHLYTGGLFRRTRHPNYLGDTLLFTGYALLVGRAIALVVPVVMIGLFTTINIPMLDRYLAQTYGTEYEHWAATTKRFLPWVYALVAAVAQTRGR